MKQNFTRAYLPAILWILLLIAAGVAVCFLTGDIRLKAVAMLMLMLSFAPMWGVALICMTHTAKERYAPAVVMAGATALMMFLLAVLTPLSLRDAGTSALVLASWCVLICGVAAFLRRIIGVGLALGSGIMMHMLGLMAMIAAPAIMRDFSHAWQTRIAALVSELCPGLALQDATLNSLGFVWPQMDVMYTLTTLGQDTPLSTPTWWHVAFAWAAAGIVLGFAATILSRAMALIIPPRRL